MGERDCCPDGTVDAVGAITGGGLEATAVSVVESGFADDVAFGVGVCVFLGDTFLVEGAFFPSLIFLRFFGLVNSGSALDASFFAFKASTFSLSFRCQKLIPQKRATPRHAQTPSPPTPTHFPAEIPEAPLPVPVFVQVIRLPGYH